MRLKFMDRVRGLIGDAPHHVLQPHGHVTADLLDDRGRVVSRQEGENYVNAAQWAAFAKTIQILPWYWGYFGDITTVTARAYDGRDPRHIPRLTNDHLCCWTDTTAEDTTDMYAFGETVAWAHRWGQGSPLPRQGLVQPTQCSLTENSVTFVFEWSSANGNGTFQSVGWKRIGLGTLGTGDPPVMDASHLVGQMTGTFTDAVDTSTSARWVSPNSIITYSGHGWYESATGFIWVCGWKGAGSALVRTTPTFSSNGNYSLSAVSDQTASAFAAGLQLNNTNSPSTTFKVIRLAASGDWVSVGNNNSNRSRISRITNAGTTVYNLSNVDAIGSGDATWTCVTEEGSNLWISGFIATASSTATGFMRKLDPTTGGIITTLTGVTGLPSNYLAPWTTVAGGLPNAIEWDAANNWFWVFDTSGSIYNINTSGAWQGVWLASGANSQGVPTLAGNNTGRSAATRQGMDIETGWTYLGPTAAGSGGAEPWSINGATLINASVLGQSQPAFLNMDGNIWARTGGFAGYNAASTWHYSRLGRHPNFGSRTLLGAPFVKTVANSMRITYTMSFT